MRFLTSIIVVAFALAGPLAPIAHAQQPAQPDLFQETLKAQRASDQSQGYYDAMAVGVNVFLVPGRALTCAAGGAAGILALLATLGTGYKAASFIVNEGCGGKWVVKGDDLRPDAPMSDKLDRSY